MSKSDSSELAACLENVSLTDSHELHPPTTNSESRESRATPTNPRLAPSRPVSVASHTSGGSASGSHRSDESREDKTGTVAKNTLPYLSQQLCARPQKKVEDCGICKGTTVVANYYPMKFRRSVETFCYNVCIVINKRGSDFELRKREECSQWFYACVQQYPNIFNMDCRKDLIYNDVNQMWTVKKLNIRTGEVKLNVSMGSGRFEKVGAVTIVYTGVLSIDPSKMQGTDASRLTALMDCVMTQRLRSPYYEDSKNFITHGRAVFFSPTDRIPISRHLSVSVGEGLEAWVGLHGAIKPNCEAGILYNCDISHSIFTRQNYNLIQFYTEIVCRCTFNQADLRKYGESMKRVGLSAPKRKLLESALKGMRIQARYADVDRSYKFAGVGVKAASAHEFRGDNGQPVTIEEHFHRKFGIPLRFPYLPCIKVGTKGVFVPMEFCWTDVTPTKYKGFTSDTVKAQMIRGTAYEPLKRKGIIQALTTGGDASLQIPQHVSESDAIMDNFGVSLEKEFVKCKASLLPSPGLIFGNNDRFCDDEHKGVWDVAGKDLNRYRRVLEPQHRIVVPAIMFVREQQGAQRNLQPLMTLLDVLNNMGVKIHDRAAKVVASYDPDNQNTLLPQWMTEYKANIKKEYGDDALPLVFFVFQQRNGGSRERLFGDYAYIKYVCDAQVGIHSQGLLTRVYEQMHGNPMTCATAHNVAIKVLAKLGLQHYQLERNGPHRNWTRLTNPDEPTLILGVDVSHADKDFRKTGGVQSLSIGCVVGNIDLDCMKFRPSVRVHNPGQEALLSIFVEVRVRIAEFVEKTGKAPAHIVVYRDGVGESQFQQTLYEEKAAIDAACAELLGTTPTLTYIVMTKRHHTRFFPTKPEDCMGKVNNLKPGTLVESVVTSSSLYDFYLLSHFGALGTSRPAHYHVLYDNWKPSNAFWPTVTHCLSYSYARCSRSISQPAPVMYAHLAAKKAKEYLLAYVGNENNIPDVNSYAFVEGVGLAIQIHKDLEGMVFT